MSDRVPLSQVVDKPEETVTSVKSNDEIKKEKENRDFGIPKDNFLRQFNDKRIISTMMGFEDNTFGGLGREISIVYQWAQNTTKTNNGDKIVLEIRKLIKRLGTNNVGKSLLRKMYQYVVFDREINRMKEMRNAFQK